LLTLLSVLTLFLVLLDTSLCVCVVLHPLCRLATFYVGCFLFCLCAQSVHRGRLLFINKLKLRSLLNGASPPSCVVCLGSLFATSLSLPFFVSVFLLSPLLSSVAALPSFTASAAVVSVGASLVLRLPHLPCLYARHPFPPVFSSFFSGGASTRSIRLCLLSRSTASTSSLADAFGFSSLHFCALCSVYAIPEPYLISHEQSAAPPPHVVLFYPLQYFPYP